MRDGNYQCGMEVPVGDSALVESAVREADRGKWVHLAAVWEMNGWCWEGACHCGGLRNRGGSTAHSTALRVSGATSTVAATAVMALVIAEVAVAVAVEDATATKTTTLDPTSIAVCKLSAIPFSRSGWPAAAAAAAVVY